MTFNGIDLPTVDLLSKHWFEFDVQLNDLRLKNMEFRQIEGNTFKFNQFSVLNMLEISDTPLELLAADTFNGLTTLKILHLDSLNILKIENKALAPVPLLEKFKLNHSGDERLKLDNLFGTVDLNHLDTVIILGCDLSNTITERTFSHLSSVTHLSLVSNKIEQIAENSFDNVLGKLENLILRSNKLISLPKNIFKRIATHPLTIDLSNNPWHCDCTMNDLRTFILNSENIEFRRIVCKTPYRFANQLLLNAIGLCIKPPKRTLSLSLSSINPEFVPPPPLSVSIVDQSDKIHSYFDLEPNATQHKYLNNLETMIESKVQHFNLQCQIVETKIDDKSEDRDTDQNQSNAISENISTMNVSLARPLQTFLLSIYQENDRMFIDLDDFTTKTGANLNKTILFGFELNPDGIISNVHRIKFKISRCFVLNITSDAEVDGEFELATNRMYRFCWITKGASMTSILDCISFYSFYQEECNDPDPWIMVEARPIFITGLILSIIFAPIFGLCIAIALAMIFPRFIVGLKSELEMNATLIEEGLTSDGRTEALRRTESKTLEQSKLNKSALYAKVKKRKVACLESTLQISVLYAKVKKRQMTRSEAALDKSCLYAKVIKRKGVVVDTNRAEMFSYRQNSTENEYEELADVLPAEMSSNLMKSIIIETPSTGQNSTLNGLKCCDSDQCACYCEL